MAMSIPQSPKILRAGIIGCGEITQVSHIPTLSFLSDYYRITYICDISNASLEHCKTKINGTAPQTTRDAATLCASPDVDVVFVTNASEYHVPHAILALQNDKFVFVEKPMAMCQRDADALIEAESKSKGKVFVGYMRRYAPAFLDAIKEVGGMENVLYVRVRDIIGPNSTFVDQSGTFPRKFNDFNPKDVKDKDERWAQILQSALVDECQVPITKDLSRMWLVLGLLGSHDLSVMREVIGMPDSVLGTSLTFPFWNVLFKYPKFAVSYESGLDDVPRFDAHIEIYGGKKTVRVEYDSPYVKGLPTTMHIEENVDGAFRKTMVRKTYEDSYTLEMKEFHAAVTEGKEIKTSAKDAKNELLIFQMVVRASQKDVAK